MSTYADRLEATKEHYPFTRWAGYEDLEQYTEENCAEAAQIFEQLIAKLAALGERAGEEEKLDASRTAVEALNALDEENANMLIETGEREELCDLCNRIASAAGLDPSKYGGGEGPASMWRDW